MTAPVTTTVHLHPPIETACPGCGGPSLCDLLCWTCEALTFNVATVEAAVAVLRGPA